MGYLESRSGTRKNMAGKPFGNAEWVCGGCVWELRWLWIMHIANQVRSGRFSLWQPVANGKTFLTQFLRLRVAGEMMAGRAIGTEAMRSQLQNGETLEIGGYENRSRSCRGDRCT